MAEMMEALPDNVYRLPQQACCCEMAVATCSSQGINWVALAAVGHHQLSSSLAQWCVGMVNKWHRHETDGWTDGCVVVRKPPSNILYGICIMCISAVVDNLVLHVSWGRTEFLHWGYKFWKSVAQLKYLKRKQ